MSKHALKSPLYDRVIATYDAALARATKRGAIKALKWAKRQLEEEIAGSWETGECAECGANTVEHNHTLAQSLVGALDILYRHSGKNLVNLKVLGLSRNQWDNFQKLKYWGLIEQEKPKSGEWRVTDKGEDFLLGKIKVPFKVITYRGVFERYEGKDIHCGEASETWKQREEYAEDAIPV